MHSFWIILAGGLIVLNGVLLGQFLLFRRGAMIADALGHAVLPGVVIGFLLAGERDPWAMIAGAFLSGLLAAGMIYICGHFLGWPPDMALLLTFSTFFSVGMLLIAHYTDKTDLDQHCVLFGHLVLLPFQEPFVWRGEDWGPAAIYHLLVLLLLNGSFVYFFRRLLVLISFDEAFALSLGVRVALWHYGLLMMTTLTSVFLLQIVGVVLIIGFFILPVSTAYLLSNHFKWVAVYGIFFGFLSVLGGYGMAYGLDCSLEGSILLFAGLYFFLALFFNKFDLFLD